MSDNKLRIVFMGTPDFAVESLKALVENKYNVVGVITVPDKPAGRGQKIKSSPVKIYAEKQNLPVLQPIKLSDPLFLEELKALQADLQIVVAFRMLPTVVWSMPPQGTFNLHGSLLPQYRGAAPINHAIINGEKETGVTTFFLKHKIDTGDILFKESVEIGENDNAGELHDKLMYIGAKLIIKTTQSIIDNNYESSVQDNIPEEDLNDAPKIFKDTCRVDWTDTTVNVHNKIRGLSPYPASWTLLVSDSKEISCKIFQATKLVDKGQEPGTIISDKKTFVKIYTSDGAMNIEILQLAGKKRMKVDEFLRGFQQINDFKAV